MKLRLVLAWIALVLPSAGLALALQWSASEASDVDLNRIPHAIDGWVVAQEDELDTEAKEMLEPDGYVFRRYDDASGTSLWAFVSFYRRQAGQLGKGAHSPEVCYPAQGFEITGQAPITIPIDPEQRLRARMLRTERDGRVEHVIYWFQPASRWPRSESAEQMLRVLDAIQGTPQYAFVRISVTTGPDDPEPESLRGFATSLAPHVRAALNSQSQPPASRQASASRAARPPR